MAEVWSHSGVWRLEIGATPESLVAEFWSHWSLESLRSLESGVWSHSGVWNLGV